MSPGPAGLAALDAHVDAAHGRPADRRFVPHPAHTRQGPPPLAAVSGHLVVGTRERHWHLVTRGLSQLAAADAGADVLGGGWGFELALRVPEAGDDPEWAVELLTNLAAYVWSSGHPFEVGHHLDLGGPMRLGTTTALRAAAVVDDPGIDALDGPFGPVEFLQVVGLAPDELEWCRAWSTLGVLSLLARHDPDLVSDLDRRSLLDDAAVAAEVAERARADGSELTALHIGTLALRRGRFGRGGVVQLGAGAAAALGPALRRELVGDGASFEVVGDGATVRFEVGASPAWAFGAGDEHLVVTVAPGDVGGLAALFDGRTGWGRRPDLPGLRFRVVA